MKTLLLLPAPVNLNLKQPFKSKFDGLLKIGAYSALEYHHPEMALDFYKRPRKADYRGAYAISFVLAEEAADAR